MRQIHEFKLENTEQELSGELRKLDFGDDKGMLFRYKDFSALQAETFAISLNKLFPKDLVGKFKDISESSSNYDASMAALSDSPDFAVLVDPQCVSFLNSQLCFFEYYSADSKEYEKVSMEVLENKITSITTLTFLRAKLIKAFGDFFTKGGS